MIESTIIYMLVFLSTIALVLVATKARDSRLRTIAKIITPLPIIILSAIRYDVGYDYLYRYTTDYVYMGKGYEVNNIEIGFSLIMNLCLLVTKDPQILFAVTSVIIYSLIVYAIYKYSKNPVLSIVLFFICGFYFDSLSLVRQYFALSLCMVFYRYIFEKKDRLKWILIVIIASLFHSSIIVLAVLPFLINKQYNWKVMLAILGISVVFSKPLLDLLLDLLGQIDIINISKYASYRNSRSNFTISLVIASVIIFIYYIFVNNYKKKSNDKVINLAINTQFLSLVFAFLTSTLEVFTRLSTICMFFSILFVPYCHSAIFKNTNKSIDLKSYRNIFFSMFLLLSLKTVYLHLIKDSYGAIEYHTVISRPINYEKDLNDEEIERIIKNNKVEETNGK